MFDHMTQGNYVELRFFFVKLFDTTYTYIYAVAHSYRHSVWVRISPENLPSHIASPFKELSVTASEIKQLCSSPGGRQMTHLCFNFSPSGRLYRLN